MASCNAGAGCGALSSSLEKCPKSIADSLEARLSSRGFDKPQCDRDRLSPYSKCVGLTFPIPAQSTIGPQNLGSPMRWSFRQKLSCAGGMALFRAPRLIAQSESATALPIVPWTRESLLWIISTFSTQERAYIRILFGVCLSRFETITLGGAQKYPGIWSPCGKDPTSRRAGSDVGALKKSFFQRRSARATNF